MDEKEEIRKDRQKACEMTQRIRMLAAMSDDPCLSPRTLIVKGQTNFCQFFSDCHKHAVVYLHTHMHTHK